VTAHGIAERDLGRALADIERRSYEAPHPMEHLLGGSP
jgi:hypothetical protein